MNTRGVGRRVADGARATAKAAFCTRSGLSGWMLFKSVESLGAPPILQGLSTLMHSGSWLQLHLSAWAGAGVQVGEPMSAAFLGVAGGLRYANPLVAEACVVLGGLLACTEPSGASLQLAGELLTYLGLGGLVGTGGARLYDAHAAGRSTLAAEPDLLLTP